MADGTVHKMEDEMRANGNGVFETISPKPPKAEEPAKPAPKKKASK